MDKPEVIVGIIGAVAGIAGAIIGALIGAIAAWWAASTTNALQKQIADRDARQQKEIAANSLALQKQIADGQTALQKDLATENARMQQRAFLDATLLKMLEFLMEYPHLEKDDFCQSYPDIKGHANGKERYEAYCIFVFNLLMTAFKHFDQDGAKLADYIGIEEIVRCHHKWWLHDRENLGYDDPFRQCIQAVIDKLRKEGKIQ